MARATKPALLLLLVGCVSTKDKPDDTSVVAAPTSVLYVEVDGDDELGTGAKDAPLASLERALEIAIETGILEISIGPGEFETAAEVLEPALDGLLIYGAGVDETTLVRQDSDARRAPTRPRLVGAARPRPVAGADGPILMLRDPRADPETRLRVEVSDLSTRGGLRAITLMDTIDASLSRIRIEEAVRTGLYVRGEAEVALSDLEVLAPAVDPDADDAYEIAYGVSVIGLDEAGQASISMEGGGIWDATLAGMILSNTVADLTDVEISGTLPDGATGAFGRGLQVQDYSSIQVQGGLFTGNADAGIFSIGSLDLSVTDATVSDTSAASVPDSAETSGDGVVAIRGADAPTYYDYRAQLTACAITGSPRAGVLLEDVTYTLTDLSGDGTWYAQGDAEDDGSTTSVTVLTDPYTLNLEPMMDGGE